MNSFGDLAQEYKCPVLDCESQTNRSGLNAEVITMESISARLLTSVSSQTSFYRFLERQRKTN